MSWANVERRSGGVARIISTAAGTVIADDSPFIERTAVSHWPKLLAPVSAALNCRVRRPRPARFSAAPMVVLQLRQAHAKFARSVFSSRPSR